MCANTPTSPVTPQHLETKEDRWKIINAEPAVHIVLTFILLSIYKLNAFWNPKLYTHALKPLFLSLHFSSPRHPPISCTFQDDFGFSISCSPREAPPLPPGSRGSAQAAHSFSSRAGRRTGRTCSQKPRSEVHEWLSRFPWLEAGVRTAGHRLPAVLGHAGPRSPRMTSRGWVPGHPCRRAAETLTQHHRGPSARRSCGAAG